MGVSNLKKASKYYDVITQMGNQGHTTNGVREIKEWYEAGVLGEVNEVHGWIGEFNFRPGHYWTKPKSFPLQNMKFQITLTGIYGWDQENIEILIQLMHLSHGEGFMILVMDN